MVDRQRVPYAALVTVPLAVERLVQLAKRATPVRSPEADAALADLERLNVEAYTIREYRREPGLSPAAQDQAEAALDRMQRRMTIRAMQLGVNIGPIVYELLDLDDRAIERDRLLRDCENYTGAPRHELRRNLVLAVRALRRGKPKPPGLTIPDGECASLQHMVSALSRELREVETVAALPWEELHRACAPLRAMAEELTDPTNHRALRPGDRRRDRPSFDDFVAAHGEAGSITEDETLPSASPTRPSARERIQAPKRRVPLLPRAELTPMNSWEDDWRALAGRKGEWLVFRRQLARWAALIQKDSCRARELLRAMVERYWSVASDRDSQGAVDALLASPSQAWLTSRTFESLVWPACTGSGDQMGFDLFGLEQDLSTWICVEVKSTDGPAETPFELTINEYRTAAREGRQYVIARVSRLHSGSPRISYWRDPIQLVDAGRLALLPVRFQVAVGALERERDGADADHNVAVAE